MLLNKNPFSGVVFDGADPYASVAVAPSARNTIVLSERIPVGVKAFIRALGNAVQAGGESSLTFRLKFNGQRVYPYDGSLNQWGDPSQLQNLPARIPVAQGTIVSVECDNSDAANTWTATARVWLEYEQF